MDRSTADAVSRREVIGMLGAASVAAVAGCAPASAAEPPGLAGLDCIVTPAQTEGPYFVDARLDRRDIRVDPANGAVSAGLPLRLGFAVVRVDGTACTPVAGAMVDVWQCDALGIYSDVRDFQGLFDTRGKRFLRGFQRTDASGVAEFLTVYPGWYAGRAVHIHFKVRLFEGERRSHEFTSQLYFDEAVTDLVHADAPYREKGTRDTRNDRDGIYRRSGGDGLLLRVAREEAGYSGRLAVGLRLG